MARIFTPVFDVWFLNTKDIGLSGLGFKLIFLGFCHPNFVRLISQEES